jgi:autotransporter-associated beta strand protein
MALFGVKNVSIASHARTRRLRIALLSGAAVVRPHNGHVFAAEDSDLWQERRSRCWPHGFHWDLIRTGILVAVATLAGDLSAQAVVLDLNGSDLTITDMNDATYSAITNTGGGHPIGALGTGAILTVNNNGADSFSANTFNGPITDGNPGSSILGLAISGSGFPVILGGTNTYSGGTYLNTTGNSLGLLVSADANLGSASSPVIFNGGTLSTRGTFTIARPIILNASGGTFIFDNTYTLTLTGSITGTGALTTATAGFTFPPVPPTKATTLVLSGDNTYTGGTNFGSGVIAVSKDGNLGAPVGGLNFSGGTLQYLASFDTAREIVLNSPTFTGSTFDTNGFSGTLSGTISGPGVLTKGGLGTLTLSGTNTYSGPTTVNAGTLDITGSIASSSLASVNSGGTLAGTGTVSNVQVNSAATFMPGGGTPGSSMTVTGNLAFQSGAIYLIQLNPATSSFANVAGTAMLGGATVDAFWANGSYISKQYTILTATGGVNGTFGPLVNTNLPANFSTSLSHDTNNAFLNLTLNFTPAPGFGGGLNGNQQNVGNALTNFFNATGGIPMAYASLSSAGLSQAAGETAVGSQQTTFGAMTEFMGLLTDPFMDRSGNGTGGAAATPFAEEEDAANAYAAKDKSRAKRERDAYAAIYRKAPPAAPFVPTWSVWAAGYGGSQTTDGNAALGSNSTTSRIAGTAVGADYRFSPSTIAGFALAGGGTNFGVNGFGTGRSDLFQAGAYVRHTQGPAYISAALAYGWQDITTNRTVTIAGVDQLQAKFNANAWSGRAEGGYRFVTPWIGGVGISPYAAAQFTTFDLPAYTEQAIVGANAFALTYAAKSVTDTRSELGVRTDKSWAMTNSILTLRGRFAWAHDFNPDRGIGATFQALPGASFVVNGAAQAHDSALTTVSAEIKWLNGWSAAATFEGEFSNVTRSYAGKGAVRYAW